MKQSYLFLARGFEEIEALTCVDLLRRADIPVKTVSITSALQVTGAHGVTVNADLLFADTSFEDSDWLILPGGMPGAENLYNFAPLRNLLSAHLERKGRVAAICAAPAIVLGQMGLLKEKTATCYPGFEKYLDGSVISEKPVVVSRDFVLANGPANAMPWSLAIISSTLGANVARQIGAGLLYYPADTENMDFNFG